MTVMEYLEKIYQEVVELKADVAELKADVAVLKTDVAELKADVAVLKADVAELKAEVQSLNFRVDSLEGRTKALEITVSQEINSKINIIAEAHLDLNRKLDKALEIRQQDEMTQLRVTSLENRVSVLEEKVG